MRHMQIPDELENMATQIVDASYVVHARVAFNRHPERLAGAQPCESGVEVVIPSGVEVVIPSGVEVVIPSGVEG